MTGPGGPGEHWVFDLDGCVVDAISATRARPGTDGLVAALRSRGARVSVWSAGGADYVGRVLDRLGLDGLFGTVAGKVVAPDGCWTLPPGWRAERTVCVDDEPGRLPSGVEVRAVRPYLGSAADTVFADLGATLT